MNAFFCMLLIGTRRRWRATGGAGSKVVFYRGVVLHWTLGISIEASDMLIKKADIRWWLSLASNPCERIPPDWNECQPIWLTLAIVCVGGGWGGEAFMDTGTEWCKSICGSKENIMRVVRMVPAVRKQCKETWGRKKALGGAYLRGWIGGWMVSSTWKNEGSSLCPVWHLLQLWYTIISFPRWKTVGKAARTTTEPNFRGNGGGYWFRFYRGQCYKWWFLIVVT